MNLLLAVPHGGRCMHEFVASAAKHNKEKVVTAMDLAKRLLDFGFHAPSVYFPLTAPEAMTMEPTETESKETMDGLVAAIETIISEEPTLLHDAPLTTRVSRPDEVRAARKPIVRWTATHS